MIVIGLFSVFGQAIGGGLVFLAEVLFWMGTPTLSKKGVPFVPVVSFRFSLLTVRVCSTDSDRMDQVGAVTSHRTKPSHNNSFNHGLHSIKKPHRW